MTSRLPALVLALLASSAAYADAFCPTPEQLCRLQSRRPAASRLQSLAAPAVRVVDDVIVLTGDERTLANDHPFDLAGKTLVFTPGAEGYDVKPAPLRYEEPGTHVPTRPSARFRATIALRSWCTFER